MKFLVAIAPNGSIAYVSRVWGGRAPDKHITGESELFTEKLKSGDRVIADRGFTFHAEMSEIGVTLITPASKGDKRPQLTPQEVMGSKRVSEARIHVERAIGKIKTYRILKGDFPINMLDVAEQIFTVCAFLTNF